MLVDQFTGTQHLIVDGAPRSYTEALSITTAMNFYKLNFFVIHLDVSREWSEKHLLSRGRFDDIDKNKIKKRLDWYETDVVPAIEYFTLSPECRYIEVNGEQSIEQVHADIISALKI
jgi:adenylate kinase family enzyme